jgi:thiamine transport system permease protein
MRIFHSLFAVLLLTIIVVIAFSSLIINFNQDSIFNIIFDDYLLYVVKFTIKQAALSTLFTIILAVPIALTLHRRNNFLGRSLLLDFLNLSFVLPSITIVIGIVIIHGKNGWINNFLQHYVGISFDYYLYGIFGIILGHLAFCLPLAVRILLYSLYAIPQETWFLTSQLNLSILNKFRIIQWPYLKDVALSLAILIFMMCFTSFTIILALGGGPSVTSIEVVIYQALRLDFDFAKALNLALIQFVISIFIMILWQKYNVSKLNFSSNVVKSYFKDYSHGVLIKILDIVLIAILFVVSVLPVIAIIINGLNDSFFIVIKSLELARAMAQSLVIAFLSGILGLMMAFAIVSGCFYVHYVLKKPTLSKFFILFANIKLIIPIFVISTGLFVFFNKYLIINDISFYLIILLNAISSLPFVVSIILPDSLGFSLKEIYLCNNLGIKSFDFIKVIYLPRLAKSISQALALSICISFGDLSIIALFNTHDLITLPYLLYSKISNYKLEEAAVISLIMVLLSFILFWLIEKIIAKRLSC